MLLDRVIIFFVLGLFVFTPDISQWWESESVFGWYSNYLPWVLIIIACIWSGFRRSRQPE